MTATRFCIGDAVRASYATGSGTVYVDGVIIRYATREEVRYGTGYIVRADIGQSEVAYHADRLTSLTGIYGDQSAVCDGCACGIRHACDAVVSS